eukprot:gene16124-18223_t
MSQQVKSNNQRIGEAVWAKAPKVNAELLTLTYGALIIQLIKDYEEISLVNEQLEKMGHNIGVRLIDEFLAKSGVTNCSNFRETADVISKIAFRMFLGISPEITNWNRENTSFSLFIVDNPFVDFVELPPDYQDLCYCNMLCGIIKGALEMVQLQVDCSIVKDVLKGDETTELRVELKGMMKNMMADEYKEK